MICECCGLEKLPDILKSAELRRASFVNPYTQQRALDLINDRKVDVSSMICECCGLEKLPDILKSAELRRKGKYIIIP